MDWARVLAYITGTVDEEFEQTTSQGSARLPSGSPTGLRFLGGGAFFWLWRFSTRRRAGLHA